MRMVVVAGVALVCLAASVAEAQVQPQTRASLQQTSTAIGAVFRRFQQEAHVPGLAWGVVADGRLDHVDHSGVQELKAKRPVNPETLFRIASMSKACTALAILKLRDEGKLSLDVLA